MIATCIHVEVKPKCIDDFIKECKKNHREAVKEPGNLRFDVLQDFENPSKFMLYEAYESEEASAVHKQTRHYHVWRNAVENMMAKPRIGVKHRIIYPENFR